MPVTWWPMTLQVTRDIMAFLIHLSCTEPYLGGFTKNLVLKPTHKKIKITRLTYCEVFFQNIQSVLWNIQLF